MDKKNVDNIAEMLLQYGREIERLQVQIAIMRSALNFYADSRIYGVSIGGYVDDPEVLAQRAQEALKSVDSK